MEKNINIKIYKLVDPNTLEIRYIGKTTQKLERRLYKHISDAKRLLNNYSHKNNWIRSLLNKNLKPNIVLIEEYVDPNNWGNIEIKIIKEFKDLGCDLTNTTEGGEGSHGVIMSQETKDKISKANKGRIISDEVKKYLSELYTGKKLTEEHKSKISESKKGVKFSDRHKNSLSLNSSGELNNFYGKKHSVESKIKMSESKKGIKKGGIKVKQLDYNGNEIKIWDSAMEASRELEISNKGIWKVCNGIKKTYKGYKWLYV